ncbi:AraC family transcriptional regulator [Paracoccus caeni]|uniref:AraC family transcriptional regulator n=1 Tax=Paracoccus caeni TaxID=657651 RepID=A0A934SLP5_9RHOB|nr:AraC family transcriptional regulator [Paracoccus caeni]MBK4216658.1 AraC family transcriptional regulator [Paracoccus caeni]
MADPDKDPLASVVALLKPSPSISKMVEAGGPWQVQRQDLSSPFYCAIVEGACVLTITGRDPVTLAAGDFLLIPNPHSFTMSSLQPPAVDTVRMPLEIGPGTFRLGPPDAPVQLRSLVGHCDFNAPDKDLLLSLLPEVIHLRGQERLTVLVSMIHDETRSDRLARSMILERLLEVLMIEALRAHPGPDLPPGLLRGMSDPQLAGALRRIHADASQQLSVSDLARDAGISRSGFFERFRKEVGRAPMDYLTAWRMAVARDLLSRGGLSNSQIARRVGYGSASAFGMAFVRHEGISPGAYADMHEAAG